MIFDYIIVGAGAAGCVLANRLSQDARHRILLLEFGGRDFNPLLYIPKGFFFTLNGNRYAYHYPTQPLGPRGHSESWTRGKVSGGSTTINGMVYMRGAAADYEAIANLGNPMWGWEHMLPAFKAMEDHQLGPSPLRGKGGPLPVSVPEAHDEVSKAIVDSALSLGWKWKVDMNEDDDERIGFTPSTISRGLRVSAASAFLHPARKRRNLTYLTRTKVAQLLFDGSRVVGVRALRGTTTLECRARQEVIISAGTVETPLLLERSGIGQPDVLRRVGIEPLVESPSVGERVIEQRAVVMQVRLKRRSGGVTRRLNSRPKQVREGLKYLLTRRGPLATGGYDLVCSFKSSPEVDRPDVQGVWVPLALDMSAEKLKLATHSGFLFSGYQIRPTTRGSIHVGGASADAAPIISARFLETEEDRKITSAILESARQIVARSPVADLVLGEEFPGAAVATPEEVVRHALDAGRGLYHAVGSAAMGPNDDDVVDGELRVRGVRGLRVVDASVFPCQPAGNTAAPTMGLAWRAADLILDAR